MGGNQSLAQSTAYMGDGSDFSIDVFVGLLCPIARLIK